MDLEIQANRAKHLFDSPTTLASTIGGSSAVILIVCVIVAVCLIRNKWANSPEPQATPSQAPVIITHPTPRKMAPQQTFFSITPPNQITFSPDLRPAPSPPQPSLPEIGPYYEDGRTSGVIITREITHDAKKILDWQNEGKFKNQSVELDEVSLNSSIEEEIEPEVTIEEEDISPAERLNRQI